MRRVILAVLVLSGCSHPVAPKPPAPAAHPSHWVLSAGASPGDNFCVEWTIDVEPGDGRPFSCISVAAVRRFVRGQRLAE